MESSGRDNGSRPGGPAGHEQKPAEESGPRDGGVGAPTNVLRFPKNWFGPTDDLVPFGPRARHRPADADPPTCHLTTGAAPHLVETFAEPAPTTAPEAFPKTPTSAQDFWSEASATVHAAVEAPAIATPSIPHDQATPLLRPSRNCRRRAGTASSTRLLTTPLHLMKAFGVGSRWARSRPRTVALIVALAGTIAFAAMGMGTLVALLTRSGAHSLPRNALTAPGLTAVVLPAAAQPPPLLRAAPRTASPSRTTVHRRNAPRAPRKPPVFVTERPSPSPPSAPAQPQPSAQTTYPPASTAVAASDRADSPASVKRPGPTGPVSLVGAGTTPSG